MAVSTSSAARGTEKSPSAFRTISEVSNELEVPQHVLRFWESKFTQVRPLKRGGGRRYYRPEDIGLLRSIRNLLYDDGYTIKGVQRLLREGGSKSVTAGKEASAPATGRANIKSSAPLSAPATGEGLSQRARADLTEVLGELEELRDLLSKAGF